MPKAHVTIGKILKPVGLKGELKIRLLTDFPDRFEALKEVRIQTETGQDLQQRISGIRYGLPFIYLTFSGLSSREAVAHLQGGSLQIPEGDRLTLPKGGYFQSDFIGMDVYLKNEACLGTIVELIETGSNDVFVVREGEHEYLIPALQDVVLDIDLKKNRMTVDPPKGLLT